VSGDFDLARMRRDRHRKVVDALDAQGLAAAVLLGQPAVAYAVGARAPAADAARAAHQRMIAIVTADGDAPHLYTAFPEGVPPELPADHVHGALPVEWSEGAEALRDVLPNGPIALDEYTMPLHAALDEREVADATALLSTCKIVKTNDELECIRRAQSINEEAMLAVEPLVAPGVRGTELSGAFLRRIFELGATANTVDPIWQIMPARVADGPYSATGDVVFPTPTTNQPFAAGDVIWVDTGIDYEGYASDFGCTFVVGGPEARHRDQGARWREIVDRVLDVLKPGATAGDLVRAATTDDGRRPWLPHLYLAHGIGTNSAEMPLVGTDLGAEFDDSLVLAPGMVLVFEPIVWDDGSAGFRAEEIVAVTDDRYERLSTRDGGPRG
jgi:Xaa-Pro aminopeptidase